MTGFENQQPIEVQCRCGWKGKSDKLATTIGSPDLRCPRCLAEFKAMQNALRTYVLGGLFKRDDA